MSRMIGLACSQLPGLVYSYKWALWLWSPVFKGYICRALFCLKKGDMHGWESRSFLVSSVGLNICVYTGVRNFPDQSFGVLQKIIVDFLCTKILLIFSMLRGGSSRMMAFFPDSCRLVACVLCLYHWKFTLVHKPRVYLESNFLVFHHLNKYLWLHRMCCLGHSMCNYDEFLYQTEIDPDYFVLWLP